MDREGLESARLYAQRCENELNAWLDRYPPSDDRPPSWREEHRRLQRRAEEAYGSWAERRYGTQ